MSINLTSETLSALAGLALSLAATYLPGFAPWYRALDSQRKQLLMLALLAGVALGLCLIFAGLGRPADLEHLAEAFIAALVANQAAYRISPQVNVRPEK